MMRRLLLVLCCIAVAGCGGDEGKAYKDRLIGSWVSAHPRYVDCLMEIQKDRMVFEADDGTIRTNVIDGIDYTKDEKGHLLQLYMTEGGDPAFIMSVYMENGPGGDLLRFKNQPQVEWHHAPVR